MTGMEFAAMPNFTAARFNMVEAQLRSTRVLDERVLNVMRVLPREEFVPPLLSGVAYVDEDIEVARGRFLMEPMVLGRLIQEAKITNEDRVLDIAPASGYSTALLAGLAREVVALESDKSLANAARANLEKLRIGNARVENGALAAGHVSAAPYDVIFVNGCVETLPETLINQLSDGGRLMAVVMAEGIGEARIYIKRHGVASYRVLFEANVRLLPEFAARTGFVF